MDSGGAHIHTVPGTQARVPANTSTVVHACTGARPGAGHCQSLGKLGRTRRPQSSVSEHCGAAAPPGAPLSPSYRYSLARFLSPSLPRSFSRSRSGRVFLLPIPPSPSLPLGRTCSRRRSRMQWGALRARASRPPQQPPGLAGFRMLRPPRAPLAVPRCPHRPHGGRLSQPEALQQGSTKAGKRRVSPRVRRAGLGWGCRAAVCNAHSPYVHTGGSTGEGELNLRDQDAPRPNPQTLWPIWRAPLQSAQENLEPQFIHPREANWAPPPSPPTTSPAPAAGSCAARSC